jgi:hypothetical protein
MLMFHECLAEVTLAEVSELSVPYARTARWWPPRHRARRRWVGTKPHHNTTRRFAKISDQRGRTFYIIHVSSKDTVLDGATLLIHDVAGLDTIR